jgi:hypothetical protein
MSSKLGIRSVVLTAIVLSLFGSTTSYAEATPSQPVESVVDSFPTTAPDGQILMHAFAVSEREVQLDIALPKGYSKEVDPFGRLAIKNSNGEVVTTYSNSGSTPDGLPFHGNYKITGENKVSFTRTDLPSASTTAADPECVRRYTQSTTVSGAVGGCVSTILAGCFEGAAAGLIGGAFGGYAAGQAVC